MSETQKSYRIKKKIISETFEVPKKLISRLSEAGETELKIFLVMASLGKEESFTEEEILLELERAGVSAEDFAEGFAFLRGAGLIEKGTAKKAAKTSADAPALPKKTQPKPTSKPAYSSVQLAEGIKNGDLNNLIDWASCRLGKQLTPADIATLYSFRDYLCLPQDVIMLGIEQCVSDGKPSLRYIEKLLIAFADSGIDTYQKAEDYILQRKNYLSFESKIRRMMGIGERSLTSREKTILADWQAWQMPEELIESAYEKTVNNTKKASMSYMNKILEGWHSSGYTTLKEVEKGAVKKDTASTFTPDDFFKIAVESSKK